MVSKPPFHLFPAGVATPTALLGSVVLGLVDSLTSTRTDRAYRRVCRLEVSRSKVRRSLCSEGFESGKRVPVQGAMSCTRTGLVFARTVPPKFVLKSERTAFASHIYKH